MSKITIIGGSKKWGSGHVMKHILDFFLRQNVDYEFIETQGSRFEITKNLWQIDSGSKVLFQPTICFPGFFRDIIVLIFLRLKNANIHILLLVDVQYRNRLLRLRTFRNYFFKKAKIFGLAETSLKIKNYKKLSPFFERNLLSSEIVSYNGHEPCFVHFGYRSNIKGWNQFFKYAKKFSNRTKFAYVGRDSLTHDEQEYIEGFAAESTLEIEKTLRSELRNSLPIYLFCSRYDFAPLMVLECGWWGVPICTIKGSTSSDILRRFIPNSCFIEINGSDLHNFSFNEAISAAASMFSYLLEWGNDDYCEQLLTSLLKID